MSMKEIKYMVWDKVTETMWGNINSLVFENGNLIEVIFHNNGVDTEWEVVDNVCLRSYMNRKDKDNREIYENDIIECDYDEMFDPRRINYPKNKRYRFVVDCPDDLNNLNDIEIVGNIFQSPLSLINEI